MQVLGDAGAAYLDSLTPRARAALPGRLARAGTTTLIVARGAALTDARRWRAAGLELRHDDRPAHEIVHALRAEIAAASTPRTTTHAVLLDVHGVGVLIEGASGAGKSTLALELLARGHALVADDAVEVRRPARGILLGACPAVTRGYLEARGLGVLDVRRLHGDRAVRGARRLDLIVSLVSGRPRTLSARERLEGRRGTRRILGESVPVLSLPAQSRHNLAALVEAACLDRRARLDGADAVAALSRRQARAIKRST